MDSRISIRYSSVAQLYGVPVVDVAIGSDESRGERRGRAKGIIAIGDIATGMIALGGIARGLVAGMRRKSAAELSATC